jgi:hypothetical protein
VVYTRLAFFGEITMADISELDNMAQELRVRWRKANNYYASFASMLFKTKDNFTTGAYGSEWTFERWLLRKAGMFEKFVMQQLKTHELVIAAEERQKVEEANIRIAVEKRAQKIQKDAEKRAAAAERRVIAEHRRRERETLRAEKQAQREAAEAAKQAAEQHAELGARGKLQAEAPEQRAARLARKKREKAIRRAKLSEGPENPDLRQLLAEVVRIEKPSRIELGRVYLEMKTIVENKQAGKDEYSRFWTWGSWASLYLHRSRTDIWKCIEEYVASCNNLENDNVVAFR